MNPTSGQIHVDCLNKSFHYLSCFEEIITIPVLETYLNDAIADNLLEYMVDELILQCKVEYNISTEDNDTDEVSE